MDNGFNVKYFGGSSRTVPPPTATDCKSAILTLSAAALFDIPVAVIAPDLIDHALGEKILCTAKRNFEAAPKTSQLKPAFFSRLQSGFSFHHISPKVSFWKNNFVDATDGYH